MRNFEAGPEPFESTHSPERAPKKCLAVELQAILDSGAQGPPEATILMEQEYEGEIAVAMECENCGTQKMAFHDGNWNISDRDRGLGIPSLRKCPVDPNQHLFSED